MMQICFIKINIMKSIITFAVILLSISVFSQTTISGKIVNKKNLPISGVNIFIEGTYDGATSTENGEFSFTTSATGNQILVTSILEYETSKINIDVANYQNPTIILRQSVNTLDAVVISAGTFRAGDNSKITALKAMDIYTTAGSNANIVAAMQTLPGTQTVGEDGRLFVRGGEANETQTFVDGIRVAQPYGATTNNLPTRGRFSPFLFSGISFSTGGYSAEYGEALSSVLLLNLESGRRFARSARISTSTSTKFLRAHRFSTGPFRESGIFATPLSKTSAARRSSTSSDPTCTS